MHRSTKTETVVKIHYLAPKPRLNHSCPVLLLKKCPELIQSSVSLRYLILRTQSITFNYDPFTKFHWFVRGL